MGLGVEAVQVHPASVVNFVSVTDPLWIYHYSITPKVSDRDGTIKQIEPDGR